MDQRPIKKIVPWAIFCALWGCAEMTPEKINSDKLLYEKASKLFEGHEYTEAITYYESLRNRFPSSPYAVEAELKIGESQFEKGDYLEAAYSFQSFRTLHPTHEKVPYAIYKSGLSYYKDSPSAIDRDQGGVEKTLSTLTELPERYPTAPETPKAAELISECKRKLLRRELYVADFYYKRDKYEAAIDRLQSVRAQTEHHDLMEEAQYKTAAARYELKQYDQSREDLAPLLQIDGSKYRKKALALAEKLREQSGKK